MGDRTAERLTGAYPWWGSVVTEKSDVRLRSSASPRVPHTFLLFILRHIIAFYLLHRIMSHPTSCLDTMYNSPHFYSSHSFESASWPIHNHSYNQPSLDSIFYPEVLHLIQAGLVTVASKLTHRSADLRGGTRRRPRGSTSNTSLDLRLAPHPAFPHPPLPSILILQNLRLNHDAPSAEAKILARPVHPALGPRASRGPARLLQSLPRGWKMAKHEGFFVLVRRFAWYRSSCSFADTCPRSPLR